MKTDIENFFGLIHSIYEQRDKLIEEKGYKFNIFNILGIHTDEVKLHSAFLAELLSPSGSHQMGSLFLEKFIEKLGDIKFTFDKKVNVTIEKDIGPISEDEKNGGRLDIEISNGENVIIIENKIYASDQNKQLIRYYNYRPDAHLFYLTLDGHEPSDESCMDGTFKVPYKCMSYEKDIIDWLESCLNETLKHPLLHNTLIQYINILKQLTNQSLIHTMDNILASAIKNNIKTALEIEREMPIIRNQYHSEFWKILSKKLNIKIENLDLKTPNKWPNYSTVISKEIGTYNGINIIIRFRISNSGIYMGITTNPDDKCKDEVLKDFVKELNRNGWSSENCSSHILWKPLNLDFKQTNNETIEYMSDEKIRKEKIKEIVDDFNNTVSKAAELCENNP